VEGKTRAKFLGLVADAMTDAAQVNLAKAQGDYSNSGETNRYPTFVPAKAAKPVVEESTGVTFDAVIDRQVKLGHAGQDGTPMRPTTEKKYRCATEEFAAFRGELDISSVTAKQADDWKWSMWSCLGLMPLL